LPGPKLISYSKVSTFLMAQLFVAARWSQAVPSSAQS
jgi:hypothetical protein